MLKHLSAKFLGSIMEMHKPHTACSTLCMLTPATLDKSLAANESLCPHQTL